jgi:hypothetical protein
MANPLRQRLGALLSRPAAPTSLHTTRAAVTKRFFAAKAHAEDDAGNLLRTSSPFLLVFRTILTL